MAESNDEWELSKENIQPIQQGRKQKVLKIALAPHPEDLILQERNAFEHELRTYSGNDPLSVWCKYIKWVEQNFPKGGREGHIKKVIERCFAILKEETKYFDDERFIDVLLKFANISGKPLDVFNYMYSHKIGCKSAKFFITWSWELEILGNLKKADQVLTEGMQRQAEPFERLQAYRKELDMRIALKLKEGSENPNFESDTGRSAFAMLKPQKKNLAPISRVGEAVIEKKNPLLLGQQLQPQPRRPSTSNKIPFKIYNSENIASSLPVQSQSVAPFLLHTENYKENEQKPSKWNKAKVKPRMQSVTRPSDLDPGFIFHCDTESSQENCTPRSVPKTSNILRTRCRSPSPVIAIFEPPDPMKVPVYAKDKVYGGAEEFSFEEIRAAQWFDRKKKREEELLLEEKNRNYEKLEKEVEKLTKQMKLLRNGLVPVSDVSRCFSSAEINYSNENVKGTNVENKKMKNISRSYPDRNPKYGTEASFMSSITGTKDTFENHLSSNKHFNKSNSATDTFDTKTIDSTSYRAADKLVQDLYNGTLPHPLDNTDGITTDRFNFDVKCAPLSSTKVSCSTFVGHINEQNHDSTENENNLPFKVFQDPTEVLPNMKKFQTSTKNLSKIYSTDSKQVLSPKLENKKSDAPFTFYNDPTEELHQAMPSNNLTHQQNNALVNPYQKTGDVDSFEDAENIPPKDYIQAKNERELAGILEPSKNILFIPLEEQECFQDDSDAEDGIISQPSDQHTDETLIPPSNTEQFSADMFLASTPCASKRIKRKLELVDSKSVNVSVSTNSVPQIISSKEQTNQTSTLKDSSLFQPVTSKVEPRLIKDPSIDPCLPKVLSVIMETSSENYSKSSSSSSSSGNLTKSGQFDPTYFNSVRKPYLKLEERHSLSSVVEVPDSNYNSSPSKKDSTSDQRKEIKDIPTDSNLNYLPNKKSSAINEQKEIENIQENLYSVSFNPFDLKETSKILKSVDFSMYKNFCFTNKTLCVKTGENLSIGEVKFKVESEIAAGSFGKVFRAKRPFSLNEYLSEKDNVALKVCRNSNEWEFYICSEIQKRLNKLNRLPDIKQSVMEVKSAMKFFNGIVLVSEYSSKGTLLDMINCYRIKNSSIPEAIVLYLTLEMLHIVSRIHELDIIHADIKPDNFLILNDAFGYDALKQISNATTSLCLIDFGRAIDLNHYKKGICFEFAFDKSHFKCVEMREKKAWVFQLDWYGVLSCIYGMLFSAHMSENNIVKHENGTWGIDKKFKRYWFTTLWEPLFAELLNIPACYQEPNVKKFIEMIETRLKQNSTNFVFEIKRLANYLP